jgi:hypothetical protein
MKSQVTYRQSQRATVAEVVVQLGIAIPAWFLDYRKVAIALLVLCCLSMICHFTRKYKED